MDSADTLSTAMGISALASITLVLICIVLSWWALQQVRWDLFLKNPKSAPSMMLQILLSIVLGYGVSDFLLAYFGWSTLLKTMF